MTNFSRYHKSALGTDLRNQSKQMVMLIPKANSERDKPPVLIALRPALDDFLSLHRDEMQLPSWKWQIKQFLSERLGLSLHNKQRIEPVANGINFLGYIVKPRHIHLLVFNSFLSRRTLIESNRFGHARVTGTSVEPSPH